MNVVRPILRSVLKRCTNEYCDVKYWEACKTKNHLACPSTDLRVLGRWHHDINNEATLMKVDYANVDHCGPCGSDLLQPRHETKK